MAVSLSYRGGIAYRLSRLAGDAAVENTTPAGCDKAVKQVR
jgi:hypothetical protein